MHPHLKIALAVGALLVCAGTRATELSTELQTYGPLKEPRPVRGGETAAESRPRCSAR